MKTAFTFKMWYWGDEYDNRPKWWGNLLKDRHLSDAVKELEQYASFSYKSNGNMRVVFKSASDLSYFILRWS